MVRLLKRALAACAAATWLAVLAPIVLACSVPVFRYALERWPPDAYHVLIIHEKPLSAEHQALLAWLEKSVEAGGDFPSVVAQAVDRSDPEQAARLKKVLPDLPEPESLPWMVVLYPRTARIPIPAWTGPFEGKALKALVGSPARREIAKRLAAGETSVWLLLESGDKKKDDAAAALLKTELAKMEKALQLPELTDDPADRLAVGEEDLPLKIAFSTLRVSRKTEAERLFIQMLLHTEEDLAELKDPMAFAFFGRGRALWALVGPGINDENIQEACLFLCGPCACQIKAMCPGTDMLMIVDWDSILMGETTSVPELAELPAFALAAPATSTAASPLPGTALPGTAIGAAEGSVPPTLVRNVAIAVGAGIVLLGAVALVMVRGKRG